MCVQGICRAHAPHGPDKLDSSATTTKAHQWTRAKTRRATSNGIELDRSPLPANVSEAPIALVHLLLLLLLAVVIVVALARLQM